MTSLWDSKEILKSHSLAFSYDYFSDTSLRKFLKLGSVRRTWRELQTKLQAATLNRGFPATDRFQRNTEQHHTPARKGNVHVGM